MKQLEEIKARASAATAGPWFQGREAKPLESVKEVYSEREPSRTSEDICTAWYPEDAEFITAARTDVPRLVAALEAVWVLADEHDAECQRIGDLSWVPPGRIRAAIAEALEAK